MPSLSAPNPPAATNARGSVDDVTAFQQAAGALRTDLPSLSAAEAQRRLRELRDDYRKLSADERADVAGDCAELAEQVRVMAAPPTARPLSAAASAFAALDSAPAASPSKGGVQDAFSALGGQDDDADQLALAGLGELAGRVPDRFYDGPKDPDRLLEYFGLPDFRDGQREAAQAALSGRDALVVMPTGGGKSLCYQLPGLATEDLTVVVSPLIALMSDQYRRLAQGGHPAVMLASGLGDDANRRALDAIRDGYARIVFCSPERFASKAFTDTLGTRKIALFVVDEAHCVSEWGHDFRPDYLRLHAALAGLGNPPVMACTATATPQVAAEIVARLRLRDPLLVHGGFDRPNLSFDVIMHEGKGAVARRQATLVHGLSLPENRPAIVYCGTRKNVDASTELLRGQGLKVVAYHAGMDRAARDQAQKAFMTGQADIVCATNAFGMGVDKADVRSVFHVSIPSSVEGYYQEAGRAGRDGKPARAVLLAMRADLGLLMHFNRQRSTTPESVAAYLKRLRRVADSAGVLVIEAPRDEDDRLALFVAERAGALRMQAAGGGRLKITLGSKLDVAKARAICQVAKDRGWQSYRAVEQFSSNTDTCRRQQLLDHFGDVTPPSPTGRCCDVCDPIDWLGAVPDLPAAASATKAKRTTTKAAAGDATAPSPLLDALKDWRKQAAGDKPAYTVAHNSTLEAIAASKPTSVEDLEAIKGVGPAFVAKHAGAVLGILARHP